MENTYFENRNLENISNEDILDLLPAYSEGFSKLFNSLPEAEKISIIRDITCGLYEDDLNNYTEKSVSFYVDLIHLNQLRKSISSNNSDKSEMSMNDRLELKGIKTVDRSGIKACLLYNGKKIERPSYDKCEKTVFKEFGLII